MKKLTMIALATVLAANAGAYQIQWEVDPLYWISGTFYIYGLGETSTDPTFGDGGFDPVTKALTSTGGNVFQLYPSEKFQLLESEKFQSLSYNIDSRDAIGLFWKVEDEDDFLQTWVVVTVDESNEHYMYDIFHPDPNWTTFPKELDYYIRWLYDSGHGHDFSTEPEEDDESGHNWEIYHHNITLPPPQYAVAPEPATGLLVLSGAALVMLRRRRR